VLYVYKIFLVVDKRLEMVLVGMMKSLGIVLDYVFRGDKKILYWFEKIQF
jgi:hypothetical protein